MKSEKMRLYGSDQDLPQQTTLRTGPFEVIFENGGLRYLQVNGIEAVRRIYAAVRDEDWGTPENQLSNLKMEQAADRFRVTYRVENQAGEIDFRWNGEIEGRADGTLRFLFDGEAHRTFLRNRIGFCVLHPAGLAGLPCRAEWIDGSIHAGVFPVDIDPAQPVEPFTDLRALRYAVPGAGEVEIQFEGDAFEMEDQRNWTDASYKTFCTPLRLPYPVEVKAGTRIRQEIHLRFIPRGDRIFAAAGFSGEGEPSIRVDWQALGVRLPGLGFGAASDGAALDPVEVDRLRVLRPHHLRVDLRLGEPGWEETFRRGCDETGRIGTRLLAAIKGSEAHPEELARLADLRRELRPDLLAILAFAEKEQYAGGTPTGRAVDSARVAFPGVPLGAGTDTDLIFLKRNVPPLDRVDLVTFAMNPQVHAFDHLSLVETLEAQRMAVESARRLAGGRPVAVSAVTLKPRWNAYATGAPAPVPPGTLPPQVDPRQLSMFAAGWTLGSVAALTFGGAAWATYYETAGWRGLMERAGGSPLPGLFPSEPGEIFPLYAVFHALAEFAGGEAVPLENPIPLRLAALAVRKGERRALLLANLGIHPLVVRPYELAPYEFRWIDF